MVSGNYFNYFLIKDKSDIEYSDFYNYYVKCAKLNFISIDNEKMDLLLEKLYEENSVDYKKWLNLYIRVSYYSVKNNIDYILKMMEFNNDMKFEIFKQMIDIERKTLSIIKRTVSDNICKIINQGNMSKIIEERINVIIDDLTSENGLLLKKALDDFDKYMELIRPNPILKEFCEKKRDSIEMGLLNYTKSEFEKHRVIEQRIVNGQYISYHKEVLTKEYRKRKKDRKER